MPEAVVFLLRAVVLVLLWGFVAATVVAVRHDFSGGRTATAAPAPPAAAPAARKAARSSPATAAARVVITDGSLVGTSYPLSGLPVTIGRAPDSTIVIGGDDYVSNHHARLMPGRGGWVLEDTGSTNGSYVAGARVNGSSPVPLRTPVRIGRTTLELRP